MIRLHDLKLIELLPDSIKNAETLNALALAIDSELNEVTNHIDEAIIIPRIDELSEDLIDLLAWQFHVNFYEPLGIDLQKKRELIKNSIAFNRLKGTKGIVENILKILYSDDVSIIEWFEYGGEPYTFKVKTNMHATQENMQKFFEIVNTIKNTRSHLDGFVINAKSNMGVFYGQVTKIVNKTYIKMDTAKIDTKPSVMYIGQYNIFKQKIRINMDSTVIPSLKQENYVSMGNFIDSKTYVKMASIKLNMQKTNNYIGQGIFVKTRISVKEENNE